MAGVPRRRRPRPYTLGVTPAVPGFARARIAPTLGDLAYAHGTVPTPSGLVTVQAAPDKLEIDTPIEADVVFGDIDTRIKAQPTCSTRLSPAGRFPPDGSSCVANNRRRQPSGIHRQVGRRRRGGRHRGPGRGADRPRARHRPARPSRVVPVVPVVLVIAGP
ncbi:MAG: hypothetical protein R2690_07925 [Acidimicrobiales bacterium]